MSPVQAAEHRSAIVAATIRLMVREGISAASTRRVAAEAGVNQATIHYVFGSKTELYRAVIEAVTSRLVQAVEAGLAPHPHWTEDAAVASAAVWEMVETDSATALLLIELTAYALRDPDLRDLAEGLHGSYHRLAENAVGVLVERSDAELRIPVEEVARLAVGGLNGLVLSFLVHGDRERSRRDLENLVDSLTLVAVGAVVEDAPGA
jgi:AcrR family transcriptional regulator